MGKIFQTNVLALRRSMMKRNPRRPKNLVSDGLHRAKCIHRSQLVVQSEGGLVLLPCGCWLQREKENGNKMQFSFAFLGGPPPTTSTSSALPTNNMTSTAAEAEVGCGPRRRRSLATATAFEAERAEHRRRQEEKDRAFWEAIDNISRESAKRKHSIQAS